MLLHFADANSDFSQSHFVIFGAPFDGTSSYRHGSKFAPDEIRKASYNLESYLVEHDVDLKTVAIHDMGNVGTLDEFGRVEDMLEAVEFVVAQILPGKFPIMLGGEHSATAGVAKILAEKFESIGIIFIDAHTDFRNQYLGVKYSHACAARRAYEALKGRVVSIGVRSVSREEVEDARALGHEWLTSYQFREMGWKEAVKWALEKLKTEKIYLSIDMDGIDPAYAPGVGTPEFFGLSPIDVKKMINYLGPRLVGADIVEVCPPCDNGTTAVLAARLVQEIIAVVKKSRKS